MTFDQRGAIISQALTPPIVKLAPTPVRLVPPPFNDLLDRTEPTATLIEAVRSKTLSGLSGPGGIGKTALLRYLCSRVDVSAYPTGVVYVEQRGQSADDLLQFLFGAFYDGPANFTPVGGALLRYLQPLEALVVVDGLTLDPSDVDHLRNTAAGCTFLFAGDKAELTEGRSVMLAGLPEDAARTLIEARLGRTLEPIEQASVHAIWGWLGGNPLHLIQGAALVAQDRLTLAELATRVEDGGPDAIAAAATEALSAPEKQVLTTMAALGDAPIPLGALTSISGQPAATVDALRERGLLQPHSPTFTSPANVKAALGVVPQEPAVEGIVRWVEQRSNEDIVEAAPVVQNAIEAAAAAHRWLDVIALARRLDRVLGPSGRWGAWKAALDKALDAARQLEDKVETGWALHQLGSRSVALGEFGPARELLSEALKVRAAAKDAEGAAVTKHNLEQIHLLESAPKGLRGNGGPPKSGGSPPWGLIAGGTIVIALLATGGIAYAINPNVISQITSSSPSAAAASPTPVESGSLSPTIAVVAPTITQVKPTAIARGATGRVEFLGTGFQQGIQVDLGAGIAVQRTSMDGSTFLIAGVSVAADAAPGPRDAVVTNPDGGQATCGGCLEVFLPVAVTSAKPSIVYPSVAAQPTPAPVQLFGSNFETGAQVDFPGGDITVTSITVVGPTEIDIQIIVAPNTPIGPQRLVVTNPDGGRAECDNCITVAAIIQ